jgi:hypothetical protein
MDAFSGLCPVGSPPCRDEEEEERNDGAENWCAARVALASRRALKHQDTRRDFNHFFTRSQELASPRGRALAGRGEKFLDGTLPGASGAPGWAGSWPAPARHSSPEDPSRAPRDKRKGTGAKSWQGCSSAQRVTVGLASTVLEVFRTLDSPIHVPPVYL